ncbi:MAG: BolA family transcriptional regulator [Brucellaceae bacterium]|jgi:BolA protein|nr:BolA family transcriptional regulator [Brucellaceae bacterium]
MSIPLTRQERITAKLSEAFQPVLLDVINESHLHAGHHHTDGGHEEVFDGTGETHYRVVIVAEAFTGLSRVDRHRAINAQLDEELQSGLHAIALEPSAPGEPTRRTRKPA